MEIQTQGTSPIKKPANKQAIYRKPKSGDTIDERYRVVGRPLGKGGMGTVYRIEDEAGVQYALKRLDPALREEKRFEKRFLLEYEAAATLKHPNIAAYQELFEAEGALHIRMELVDGINLRELLKREKRLPLPIAAGIGRALARALEHLHEHRVVHRDIKPENVLLGRDGSIKLTDFGISRLEYAGVTRTGTIMGTPRYMSPEQLAGKKGEEIGPESDIYSLGVLLYELLVGKDPYRLKQKAEVLEVINVKHQKTSRPLPTEFDEPVRQLLLSMLEHNPAERPSDARKLGQELGRWSASRRELRTAISEWSDDLGPDRPKAKLAASTRKRDSFWQDPLLSESPEETIQTPPTSQGHELLPAFIATLVFLMFLWGLGFWYQKESTSAVASASLQRTAPHAHAQSQDAKQTAQTYAGLIEQQAPTPPRQAQPHPPKKSKNKNKRSRRKKLRSRRHQLRSRRKKLRSRRKKLRSQRHQRSSRRYQRRRRRKRTKRTRRRKRRRSHR